MLPFDLPLGFLVFFIILALFIVFLVVRIVRELRRRRDVWARGTRVVATVADIRTRTDLVSQTPGQTPGKPRELVYVTTASMTDPQTGQQHTFTDSRRRQPNFKVGDPVVILVDPANPDSYVFAD